MSAGSQSTFAPLQRGTGLAELALPIAVVGIVISMIAPLPPFLLDLLIGANLTISVLVLLVSLSIKRAAEFNVFPSTLLLLTLFRLALNISSSRLILLNGSSGTHAAGDLIEAFGTFVVGGNYFVGASMFLVLIAIQYIVINHGAVRIAEVAARFTLDALPGKQISIDSDLSRGLIDEPEARTRRRELAAEAEFYGAMDGASRFTQRDAVATLVITAVNIAAGFLTGVLQHGMDLKRAVETYTVLTIGDGLVTVLPALMMSLAGGLIVTRASSSNRLATDVRGQLFSNPRPVLLSAGALGALALLPGFPALPLLGISAAVGAFGWRMRTREDLAPGQPTENLEDGVAPAVPAAAQVKSLLKVEPLSLEVGIGLIHFLEGGTGPSLLNRIASLRNQLAEEIGFVLPSVRVADNLQLQPREYVILVKGGEVARFELAGGKDLALLPAAGTSSVEGVPATDPAFGGPALWVASHQAAAARGAGYTIVDPLSLIVTHFGEIVRTHAHELFSRQDAKLLLDRVAEENPKVVEDLVPQVLSLAAVQTVLRNLLRERVSIRDAVSILEALGEAAAATRNPVLLTEYVRKAIRRQLVRPYLTPAGDLPVYFLAPALEQDIEDSVEHTETASRLNLPPQRVREIAGKLAGVARTADHPVVVMTTSSARHFLGQIAEAAAPGLAALSQGEVPAGARIISLGAIS